MRTALSWPGGQSDSRRQPRPGRERAKRYSIPMLAAPVAAYGIDPVHLGLVIIFNLMIGLITPPMGLSLFMVSNVASISMKEVLVEMPPYFISLILTLALLTYFPMLTLWIPSMLK